MRIIEIDAAKWTSDIEFYRAILVALKAPDWHGISIDALIDSMIWGGINVINPPYVIQIYSVALLAESIVAEIELVKNEIAEAREEFRIRKGYDVDVSIEIMT